MTEQPNFTTYRWPDATEYALVAQARDARGDGVIVSLLRSDLPGDNRELAADDRLFVETGLHALVLEPGPPPPVDSEVYVAKTPPTLERRSSSTSTPVMSRN